MGKQKCDVLEQFWVLKRHENESEEMKEECEII